MAIDMFTDNPSLCASPRISFSHDLHGHTAVVPGEQYCPCRADSSLLDSDSEFDFCISNTNEREISAADELFSDGLIKPLMLHEKFVTSKHISVAKSQLFTSLPPLPAPSTNEISSQDVSKQIISTSFEKNNQSKSFWRIKRSNSVHCDNSYKKGSLWALPRLSRSNSTGSVLSSKQMLKDGQKMNSQKNAKGSMVGNSSSSSSSFYYTYPLSQKPPLNRNYGGSYGKGVRISPVLNVPPPYISKRTANLFGLGSFFCNNKDKKNKK